MIQTDTITLKSTPAVSQRLFEAGAIREKEEEEKKKKTVYNI